MSASTADPALADVAWDLSPLLNGAGDGDPQAACDAMLAEAQSRADAFADQHAGRVAELDAAGLAAAMQELAGIHDLAGRVGNYAALAFSTDTADPKIGALMQRVQEQGTPIETKLLFFELEWAAIDDATADALLAGEGLDHYRHYLQRAPSLPPAPALRARGEAPGREVAHVELGAGSGCSPSRPRRSRSTSARASPSGSRSRSHACTPPTATCAASPPPPRSPRRCVPGCARAASSSTRCSRTRWSTTGCAPTRTGCRRATSPTRPPTSRSRRSSRPCVNRYELPRRWYRLKAEMLGIDRLADYDRMAAVDAGRRDVRLGGVQGARARLLQGVLLRARRGRGGVLRPSPTSTRRRGRPSGAGRSARTRCPRRIRT